MKKKYVGRKMMERSRLIAILKTMDASSLGEVEKRIDVYIRENPFYCDKRNYQHLCNIFTSMSLYYVLIEQGILEEEALNIVFDTMYAYMQKQKEKFQKLARKRWFFPLMRKIVPLGFKYGSGHGWEYCWHKKSQGKNELIFETKQCIYEKIFAKYGLLERFGPRFCHNDIIVYGELPQTDFIRMKTLCRGDDCCDFKFVRHKKGEPFARHKSV